MEAPISLRHADPTLEDGLVFARLVDYAQEGMMRMKFGKHAGEVIARAFIQPGHDLCYSYVTFAERDGRILGTGSGYTGEEHRNHTDEVITAEAAASGRRWRQSLMEWLAQRPLRFMEVVPDGDFYLRALAVEPAYRGSGIGTQLLQRLEGEARRSGSKRLSLDVATKNRRGRQLYERFGFEVESESPRFFGLPRTNVARMVKTL
ncbi:MAG: GNAT family N-acetyltransferase [Acidimicrobiia bacterium]|nr:GNAT family N-acetyltransferase [Acidimicrobiia bacterium]